MTTAAEQLVSVPLGELVAALREAKVAYDSVYPGARHYDSWIECEALWERLERLGVVRGTPRQPLYLHEPAHAMRYAGST